MSRDILEQNRIHELSGAGLGDFFRHLVKNAPSLGEAAVNILNGNQEGFQNAAKNFIEKMSEGTDKPIKIKKNRFQSKYMN